MKPRWLAFLAVCLAGIFAVRAWYGKPSSPATGAPNLRTNARTPQNDPLMESTEPLFREPRPLPGGDGVSELTAHGSGFLAVREVLRQGVQGCELLRWTHPGQEPVVVAAMDGVITDLVVAPDGSRCGASIVYPQRETGVALDDPGMVAIIDLRTGAVSKVHDGAPFTIVLEAAFSPDGTRFAVARDRVTHVHDLASRREVDRTEAQLMLSPSWFGWDAEGLLLHFHETSTRTVYYRWQPGQGKPQEVPEAPLRAPGGRYTYHPTERGGIIRGPDGERTVRASRPRDEQIFQNVRYVKPWWLGPMALILFLDEEGMALDLASGKMRYLFSAPGLDFKAATADGRVAVASDGNGHHFWSQR